MPTTYAHDLFGKKIYAKLPAEIQKVIRRNTNLYRIGLHGPDILFYDMLKPKVTETGIAMHKECARILCFQEQKLCHDNAGAHIIYLFSKKDDTVFQKAGVNVIASFSSACLFNDIWY